MRLAPALTIVPHIDDEELIARSRALIAEPPDIVVVTTGVGFRGWIEAADEAGLLEEFLTAIRPAQIVARGPKARGAIQQAGLSADWVAESETAAELEEFLLAEGVAGKRIAVQHHGSGADGLDEAFESAGADVVSLTIYRWGPPPDLAVVRRSVIAASAGEYDAILFTSAPGAQEWLGAADILQVLPAMRAHAQAGRLLDGGGRPHHRRAAAAPPASSPSFPTADDWARSSAPWSRTSVAARRRESERRRVGSSCAVPASCWTDGTSPCRAWDSTSSPRSSTRTARSSRAKSCRARCPARCPIRTPSR